MDTANKNSVVANPNNPETTGWDKITPQTFATSEDSTYFGVNQVLQPPHLTDLTYVRSSITDDWVDKIAEHVKSSYEEGPSPTIKFTDEPAIPINFIRKLIGVGTQLLSQLPNVVEIGVPLCKDGGIPKAIRDLAASGGQLKQMPNAFDQTPSCAKAENELGSLPKLVLVGDLHGTFEALYAILKNEGMPSSRTHYVFNGDYIDRGSFSVEVFVVILALFVRSPSSCVLLRGNHETKDVVLQYSFEREIQAKYAKSLKPTETIQDIVALFVRCFQFLPLACLVGEYLILHGGIPARPYMSIDSIMQIKRVREPIAKLVTRSFADVTKLKRKSDGTIDASSRYVPSVELFDPLSDILWADPYEGTKTTFNEVRQTSILFGEDTTKQFLDRCGVSTLIRSHMNYSKGLRYMHGGRTITVFSVPNYQERDLASYLVFLKEADSKIDEAERNRRLDFTPPDLSKKKNVSIVDMMGCNDPDSSFREREPNGKKMMLLCRKFDTSENAHISNQPFSVSGLGNMREIILQNLGFDLLTDCF